MSTTIIPDVQPEVDSLFPLDISIDLIPQIKDIKESGESQPDEEVYIAEYSYSKFDVIELIFDYLKPLDNVKSTYITWDGDLAHVWIEILKDTDRIRDEVYSAQYKLFRSANNEVKVDFHTGCGVVPDKALLVFKK